MEKRRRLLLVGVMLGVFLTPPIPGRAQDCTGPPQGFGSAWWVDYANWCRACGGTPNVASTTCTPGPNWGRSGGSSSGSSAPRIDIQEQLRQQEMERKRREEEERKRRMLREAKEETERRAEEATKAFRQGAQDAAKQLKRDAGGGGLEIKGSTGTLGVKGTPDVSVKRPEGGPALTSSVWGQLQCGMHISGYALSAARKGDSAETAYLARQATTVFDGGVPGVECPKPAPPPKPYGELQLGQEAPVVQFYRALLTATEREASRVERADMESRKAMTRQQKLAQEIAEKEKAVAGLREEIRGAQAEPSTPSSPPALAKPASPGPTSDSKGSALAEALAALQAAKEANAGIDSLIQAMQKDKNDATTRLDQYEQMFHQVQREPQMAPDLMGKIPR